MTETEVKDELFKMFNKWMKGKTVGVKDGKTVFYESDVREFISRTEAHFKLPVEWSPAQRV